MSDSSSSSFVHSAPISPSRKASGWAAASFVGASLALTAATVGPARWLLALEQGHGVTARALFFAGGLLSDLATVGPLVALALVVTLSAPALPARASVRRVIPAAFGALLVTITLVHNAAVLFRVERGVFPGPIDARESLAAPELFLSELPEVLGGRFLSANLVGLVIVLLVGRRIRSRWLEKAGTVLRPRSALGLAVGSFVLLGVASRNANAYCERLHNGGAIVSPASTWIGSVVGPKTVDGTPADIRLLVSSFQGTTDDVERGARAMGFTNDAAARSRGAENIANCNDHPLARRLEPDPTALGAAARDVSSALFRDEAPIVFHVSLESFRADDIAALEPLAPRAIAPFLTKVYEDNPSFVAFRQAHQSGIRTAHALAAVQCGVGALPFHLALGRDLGNVPLRCLPDVLHDAGFQGRVFYGHELAFDDMGTFLRYHGLELHERADLPRNAPRGVWGGVSDAPVYDAALSTSASDPRAQYNFILTLSHHTPFTEPDDLAPELKAEVNAVCVERGLTGENCARLRTLRYADNALSRFIERIETSKDAHRTIVVFGADHTTHQWVPWGDAEKPDGITRIPLVVWIPKAFRDLAPDPLALAAAWSRLRALATSSPISNTDVPTLLVSLLAGSPGMRALPASSRWHTLGGQATSSAFQSPIGEGALFGIDAHARLFSVDTSGATRPSNIGMDTLRTKSDVLTPMPANRAMLAFWGSFLRGYGAKCARPIGATFHSLAP